MKSVLKIAIERIVRCRVIYFAACLQCMSVQATPVSVNWSTYHSELSESRELYHLRQHEFATELGYLVGIQEGFLLEDTNNMAAWNAVGGSGKFHASTNQDPEISESLLLTSAIRIKHQSSGKFRFCSVDVSAESTMKRQVVVELLYLDEQTVWSDGAYKTEKKWGVVKNNLSQGGTFLALNLSSKNVYEVFVRGLNADGEPVLLVFNNLIVDHENGSCN